MQISFQTISIYTFSFFINFYIVTSNYILYARIPLLLYWRACVWSFLESGPKYQDCLGPLQLNDNGYFQSFCFGPDPVCFCAFWYVLFWRIFCFCGYEMGCLLILHGNECYSVVLNYFLILPCLTRNFSLSNNDPPFLLPPNVLLLFFTFYLKVLFQGVK